MSTTAVDHAHQAGFWRSCAKNRRQSHKIDDRQVICWGGAGGLESVLTVLAVHKQVSPPTINIFNQSRSRVCERRLRRAVFGGTNGTLIFGRA
jgi:hypothetical protein